jgi:magnesium-transporting ATPase (P-type)
MSSATYYEKYSLMIGYRNINKFSVFLGIEDEDHPALSNSYLSITSADSSEELINSEVYFPNNSLKSLYKFIKWSRHSFQFVRKLLQLFLPASIVAAGVMIVSGLFFQINPFSITQLIWVTIFSCGMIAINLSLEKPQES